MIPKFRAWSKKFKRMYEVTLIDYENGDVGLKDDHGGVAIGDIKQLILMQSTGMFDKNGVEIFEGDIVKIKRLIGSRFLVERHKKTTQFILRANFWMEYFGTFGQDELEVVGNIYENPELLESVDG
ncbi:YopX family protein [Streptococcus agalactiae]|uniref:YopX family protein n=1 Tax=Streptococcus agalactiae TaxID=1311 RepID=UPI001C97BF2A|nr:YopX family protein [Streptococcus agalactiae]MBY5051388.1 YopX family protein [Streptococcus agalactiae]